jgi:hypothetical protein
MLMSRESSCDSIKASVSWILTNVADKAEIGKLHMNLTFRNKDWSLGNKNVNWRIPIYVKEIGFDDVHEVFMV